MNKIIITIGSIVGIAFVVLLCIWSKNHFSNYLTEQRHIQQLKSVDIEKEFQENISNKDFRIVTIKTRTRTAPGFTDKEHEKLSNEYGYRTMYGTSDVVTELTTLSGEYALKYNTPKSYDFISQRS